MKHKKLATVFGVVVAGLTPLGLLGCGCGVKQQGTAALNRDDYSLQPSQPTPTVLTPALESLAPAQQTLEPAYVSWSSFTPPTATTVLAPGLTPSNFARFDPVYVKELKNYEVTSLDENATAQLYVGTKNNGLWVSTSRNNNIYNDFKKILNVPKIQVVKTDENNGVWVGTNQGVYYSPKGVTFAKVTLSTDPDASVDSLLVDKDENLWVGTLGWGLWKAPLGSTTFSSFPEFQNKYVLSIAKGAGTLFVGTNEGLYKTTDNKDFALVKSLGKKIINAIYQKPAKKPQGGSKISEKTTTLVGTEVNGLWVSHDKAETFTQISPPATNTFVTSIARTTLEESYVGTSKQSLWYRPTSLTAYQKVSFGVAQVKTILGLYRDNANDLWIGTGACGLYYIPS